MYQRDLNTLLPTFFTVLLNLTTQSALLPAILTALHSLIPQHPTIFRPSLARTQAFVTPLLVGDNIPTIQQLASKVYRDLHHAAPKGFDAEHWRMSLLAIIEQIHLELDHLFKPLEEGCNRIARFNVVQPKARISSGIGLKGLKELEGSYTASLTERIQRIQRLIVAIEEFTRFSSCRIL